MSISNNPRAALTLEEVRMVSPALAKYSQSSIDDDLWMRPDLSRRDRSIVTVAALIARNQTIGMLHYFNVALDNGVKPGEISEIITHLAFYSGWSNAFSAVAIVKDILDSAGSDLISFPRHRRSFSPSMKPPRHSGQHAFSRMLARWLRGLCSTPAISFSVSSGYVRP